MTQQNPKYGAVENAGIVRELGYTEKILKFLHDESIFILSNALLVVSKEQLTEELILKALNRLLLKVPHLQLCFQENVDGKLKKTLHFVKIEDFQIDFELLDTNDWIGVISDEWQKPFNCETGPLWRVKFLPNVALGKKDHIFQYEYVFIFSHCHSILDGMSYQRVYGLFLDCLEEVHSNVTEHPIPMKILPALEDFIGLNETRISRFFVWVLKMLLKRATVRKLIRSLIASAEHPYLDSIPAVIEENPTAPQVTSFVPLEFTVEETSNIVRACKARNTTVNGALCAAAFLAFMRFLPGKSPKKVTTFCPINLRRHLSDLKEHQDDSLGVLVSLCEIKPNPNIILQETSNLFWSIVKDTNEQINKNIRKRRYAKEMEQMSIFMSAVEGADIKLVDLLMNEARYGRGECLVLTNMGKCDFLTRPEKSNFKLAGRFGGAGEYRFGAILTHNLNTINDRIYWTIIYSKHIINIEKVEESGKWIREILHKFCCDTAV